MFSIKLQRHLRIRLSIFYLLKQLNGEYYECLHHFNMFVFVILTTILLIVSFENRSKGSCLEGLFLHHR